MSAAPAIIMGAGVLMKSMSSIRQGNMDNAVAQHNAILADQNAQLSRQDAAEEERRYRILSQKQIGTQRAAIGASGVELEGSPLDALANSASNAELESAYIKYQGEARAFGYEAQGKQSRFTGSQAKTQGYMSAAGELLSGGGAIAGGFGGGGSSGRTPGASTGRVTYPSKGFY